MRIVPNRICFDFLIGAVLHKKKPVRINSQPALYFYCPSTASRSGSIASDSRLLSPDFLVRSNYSEEIFSFQ